MDDSVAHILDRLEAVEARSAHQDLAITELNEVITAQWKQIDLLERKLARLQDELQNMAPTRDGPEPPPPHY